MRSGKTVGMAIGVACAVLASSVPGPATAAGQITLGDVQQAMENIAKIDGVVGAIGEVYVDGRRVGRGVAGSRLLDGKGGRIPSGSRYRMASQTKLMEAAVILQLVGEGKLGLDDKLSDVLPEVAENDWVERADEITVRQLIRHTSGIPDFIESGQFDVFDFTTSYRLIDLVKAARTVPRQGEPGEYRYSTTNYVLLGMIIERVTGHDRASEFKRRLFAPLGMNDSYLATKVSDHIKGPHGHGYYPDAEGNPRNVDRLNATSWGVEGAISTAHDVSAFYRALNQGRLVPTDLQQQMPRPRPSLCGETVASGGGSMPGINSTTFSSTDGRIQFAVATTLKIDNMQAMAIVPPSTRPRKPCSAPVIDRNHPSTATAGGLDVSLTPALATKGTSTDEPPLDTLVASTSQAARENTGARPHLPTWWRSSAAGRSPPWPGPVVVRARRRAPATAPPPNWCSIWTGVLALNLRAAVEMTRAALPALSRARGAIVNISSSSARDPRGVPLSYAAAKAALSAFSRGLAEKLGDTGVRVNVVTPRRHPDRDPDEPGRLHGTAVGEHGHRPRVVARGHA